MLRQALSLRQRVTCRLARCWWLENLGWASPRSLRVCLLYVQHPSMLCLHPIIDDAHTCHWCQKLEERNAHRMKEFRGTAHAAATQVAHARRRGRLQSNATAAGVPHHVELPPAVIAHFVGVAPGSDNLRPILQRLVQELRYVVLRTCRADTCICALSDTAQPCLVWPQRCLETRHSDAP